MDTGKEEILNQDGLVVIHREITVHAGFEETASQGSENGDGVVVLMRCSWMR